MLWAPVLGKIMELVYRLDLPDNFFMFLKHRKSGFRKMNHRTRVHHLVCPLVVEVCMYMAIDCASIIFLDIPKYHTLDICGVSSLDDNIVSLKYL